MRDIEKVVAGFKLVLEGIGAPQDEHTLGTAQRAAEAWFGELCIGLGTEPPEITAFESDSDAMVILREIPIKSLCAHHLLPFVGVASVGYIPGTGKVVGLSKLSRLADYHSRRPQVQERLTLQIAKALADHVMHPSHDKGGVGVVLRAHHMCMECRGVNHKGDMVTSELLGVFRAPEVRAEFFRLAGY
jgi:GTP cyclohydrolase IA